MLKHLNPEETALILVDVQNDFCHENGACAKMGHDVKGAQTIIPNIQLLIKEAREKEIPVVFIQMTQEDYTISDAWANRPRPAGFTNPLSVCKKNTWGAEFYEIAPEEGDITVEKHRYSAFIATELDMILRQKNCKSIVITGVATNVCVESTARDGFMLDYHVTVVKDASAGYVKELHDATFENIQNGFGLVLDTEDVVNHWSKTKNDTLISH